MWMGSTCSASGACAVARTDAWSTCAVAQAVANAASTAMAKRRMGSSLPPGGAASTRHARPGDAILTTRGTTRFRGSMTFITEQPLTPRAFLDECIEFKRTQPGPGKFFMALMGGTLTRPQLHRWAKDMYHFVGAGIPALTAWLAHAPTVVERDSARLVAKNLAGELGFLKEADHRDLYLQFLDGLGVTEEAAKDHLPLPSTIGGSTVLGHFCRSSFAEGLGSFGLGIELQVPGRPNGAKVILDALGHYDIPKRALEFYEIHVEAEEEHGDNAERALAPFVQTAGQQTLVRHAFQWTVLATQGMQRGFDAYLS